MTLGADADAQAGRSRPHAPGPARGGGRMPQLGGPTLRRASGLSPLASLGLRAAGVLILIGIALAGHWFDREGLRDNVDGAVSFLDVVYFTMITVTTVGYGDIVPVTTSARLFDTFVVTPVRIFVWLIFLGTAYQFLIRNIWERWRMKAIQQGLHDHVIVAGYGNSGTDAVGELIRRGVAPDQIVVIDDRPLALEKAQERGAIVLEGDATRNSVLEAAKIRRARAMLVAAGRDDTSILIVLTARLLAPHVTISVVVRAEDNEPLARQAGAQTVINPATFAGLLLAGSADGPHVAEYMADLAATEGRVALRERRVEHDELGRPLSAIRTGLGVRIYRDGACIGFWEDGAAQLRHGDIIVEIMPQGVEATRQGFGARD